MTISDFTPGSEWMDTVFDDQRVRFLGWRNDEPWFENLRDGTTFYCCAEDLYLWRRFTK